MEEPQESPQNQSNIDLPPLLALPIELTLKIISIFADTDEEDDDDTLNKIALIVLRRTHSSFRRIIAKPKPTYDVLFEAEKHHSYLFPSGYGNPYYPDVKLPCYDCHRFFEAEHFRQFSGDYSDMPRGTILGRDAGCRACDYCWKSLRPEMRWR